MSIEFEVVPVVTVNESHDHTKEEYCAILDALIGKMTGNQIAYWVKHGKYVWAVKDKVCEK